MIPTPERLALTHAAIQFAADAEGARALHLKGPALHEELLQLRDGRPVPRHSTDADVLVEPRHARRLVRRLIRQGWRRVASFETGSPFGHAATVWHDQLGYADIHRYFPGIGMAPDDAFRYFWHGRTGLALGHQLCWVPSLTDQRLILLLHAARSGGTENPDVDAAWLRPDDEVRAELRALAHRLRAELPLAAAIGELDDYRGDRHWDLWHQFSTGAQPSRSDEWRARIKAARGPVDAAKLAVRSVLVNTDRLAMDLGRRPTRREVWQAWTRRMRQAVDENVPHPEHPAKQEDQP